MDYQSVFLESAFEINEIITIHYFEYRNDFSFSGETHNFWEFLCVDKGEVDVIADSHKYSLARGNIIFHRPNEFHNVAANGKTAPNLVVVAFKCNSPQMDFFSHKILSINEFERNLLAQLIIEAQNVFSCRLDDPYLKYMTRSEESVPIGSEQLIKVNLELFLIHLIRRYTTIAQKQICSDTIKQKSDNEVYKRILEYLEMNIHEHLTVEQITRDNLVGRSQLQKLIRQKHGCGIIDYFSNMKINRAKHMIRENKINFTQISDALGYNSIHYFSRQFKKITRMTPSEYSSSIKGLSEIPQKESEDATYEPTQYYINHDRPVKR